MNVSPSLYGSIQIYGNKLFICIIVIDLVCLPIAKLLLSTMLTWMQFGEFMKCCFSFLGPRCSSVGHKDNPEQLYGYCQTGGHGHDAAGQWNEI